MKGKKMPKGMPPKDMPMKGGHMMPDGKRMPGPMHDEMHGKGGKKK